MKHETIDGTLRELGGERCLVVDGDAPTVRDAEGARALIEAALGERATMIAIDVSRLDPAFFELRSGLAGEVLQKAANYRLKFVVVGDISGHVAASDALRDFVVESNRGRSIFFAADLKELADRLLASTHPSL